MKNAVFFFPPDFSILVKESTEYEKDEFLCLWCKMDKNEITVKPKTGLPYLYTRDDCVKEWKVFMKQLLEKKNIKETLSKVKR